MLKQNSILFRSFCIFLFTIFCFGLVVAQDDDDGADEPQLTVKAVPAALPNRADEDDSKVTGATVRGRLVYEDTQRPLRYAFVTLVSVKSPSSIYGAKYVKTDENGEFVIKNVKAGTYLAHVKSDGILNQDAYWSALQPGVPVKENRPEDRFEKFEIGGLGEFQIVVAARRGAAITGRIVYADGEAAVGVKVEVLRKEGELFIPLLAGYGTAVTDDRGIYRIIGLSEGRYVVRAVEPVSHTPATPQSSYNLRDTPDSIFKTYYPEGDALKDAKEVEVFLGQEQAAIDIALPERRLFTISGRIVKKGSNEPLANFSINFFKIAERDERFSDPYEAGLTSGGSSAAVSNKAGEWSLKSLPKGKYRISIRQGYEYRSEKDAQKTRTEYPDMSKEIEITDKNPADLNFEVPVESSITGTITVEGGKALPGTGGVFVIEEKSKASGFSDAFSANGNDDDQKLNVRSFRIGKLQAGNYQVSYSNENYYAKSITLNGRDVMSSTFELREGEKLSGLRIVAASDMGTVKGEVAGYDGKQPAGVFLVRTGLNFEQLRYGGTFFGQIMPDGKFEVKAAPGEFQVVVFRFRPQPKDEAEAREWFEKLAREAPKVTVKDGETVNISVSLPN